VRRQIHGYLPSHRTLPLPLDKYLFPVTWRIGVEWLVTYQDDIQSPTSVLTLGYSNFVNVTNYVTQTATGVGLLPIRERLT